MSDTMSDTAVQVGGVFKGAELPAGDGPLLDWSAQRRNLVLKLKGLSEQEVRDFAMKGSVELALFEQKSVIFVLIKVAGVIGWSDAPYSVAGFSKESWPEVASGMPLSFQLVLVEGADQKVKAVRPLELEASFSEKLAALAEAQKKAPISPEELLKTIAAVQKKATPEKMLAGSVAKMTA